MQSQGRKIFLNTINYLFSFLQLLLYTFLSIDSLNLKKKSTSQFHASRGIPYVFFLLVFPLKCSFGFANGRPRIGGSFGKSFFFSYNDANFSNRLMFAHNTIALPILSQVHNIAPFCCTIIHFFPPKPHLSFS